MENQTKKFKEYPAGQAPDLLLPKHDKNHRFLIGKSGKSPLVSIALTPSSEVSLEHSSEVINTIIQTSKKLVCDSWICFYLYPEIVEKVEDIQFDQQLLDKNIRHLERFILQNEIKDVWGIWGDFQSEALEKGKKAILEMLQKHHVKIFYFGTLTGDNNPRQPLQTEESWHMFNPNKMFLEG